MSSIKLVQYHTWFKVPYGYESAVRCAFVQSGRKWIKVVCLDASVQGGLRVRKVPMADQKYMTPLEQGGEPYPVKRALKAFRRVGATHGITKGAKKLLKEATNV